MSAEATTEAIRDTARLDLIEQTKNYPWPEFGGKWKFRDKANKLHVADSLRGVLDLALAEQLTPSESPLYDAAARTGMHDHDDSNQEAP